jgi:hypothetical protein
MYMYPDDDKQGMIWKKIRCRLKISEYFWKIIKNYIAPPPLRLAFLWTMQNLKDLPISWRRY